MGKTSKLPEELVALAGARSYAHGFLPLAAAYCRRLGIVETVDALVPSKMNVRPGLMVQAMVLDTLSGRSPLYRLEEFLAEQDIELLVGPGVEAHDFNTQTSGGRWTHIQGRSIKDCNGNRRERHKNIRVGRKERELRHHIHQRLGRLPDMRKRRKVRHPQYHPWA